MAVGKTAVSSSMIDRVAAKRGRKLYEVPVGFKYFVDGLLHGDLGLAGEESAGSSFARRDGSVWTTDKDGIIAALLAAEITAICKKDKDQAMTLIHLCPIQLEVLRRASAFVMVPTVGEQHSAYIYKQRRNGKGLSHFSAVSQL